MTNREPVIVPDDAYAIIIQDNKLQIVTPDLPDDAKMTDGHFLLLGLVNKLKEPAWAEKLINETAEGMVVS